MDEDEKSLVGLRMMPEVMKLERVSTGWEAGIPLSLKFLCISPHCERKDIPKDRTSGRQKHGEKDLTASTKLWGLDPSHVVFRVWKTSDNVFIIVQSFCLDQGSVLLGSGGHTLDFNGPKNIWVWKTTSSESTALLWTPVGAELTSWLPSLVCTVLGCGRKGIMVFYPLGKAGSKATSVLMFQELSY